MKIVIVGGVAGGATAAARLRRMDEQAEIVMLERSGHISYANCGLPYYIGGAITDRDALTLQTPERFWQRFRIDARVHSEVTAIDPQQRTVTVKNLADGAEYTERYDRLLLSPGARPVKPPLPGIDGERIVTVRTVEDTLHIADLLASEPIKDAVIVGGGFIGLEMAENLSERGIRVTIVERLNQVMMPLDYDMASIVHQHLHEKGVSLRLEASVTGFAPSGAGVETMLEGGEALASDLVVLAIGVAPDTALARDAGLALGPKGSIVVDDHMRTSAEDIYAVGDAVEVHHRVSGKPTLLALAGPANKQARIAADNMLGGDRRFAGVQGTSVLKLFDMTIAATGLNEKLAVAEGIVAESVVASPSSHAGYYPGSSLMTIKALFSPEDGRILGAQALGMEGVDKRIDVLATAIHAGMTAADLAELELAYAPPFSSAKDPVNMIGFMIENILAGRVKQFFWRDVPALQQDANITLLDARSEAEHEVAHIDGAINIPLDRLRDRLEELPRERPVYVYCHSGMRSYVACRILAQHGFDCYNLSGGFRFYQYAIGDAADCGDTLHPCGIRGAEG